MNDFLWFNKRVSNDLVDEDEVLIVQKIYENIEDIYNLKLSDLANLSYSSSSTIIRFLRRIGFKSYSDFKNRISIGYEELKKDEYQPRIQELTDLIQNSFTRKQQNIEKIVSSLDEKRIDDLIHLIMQYRTVTFIGSYLSIEILHVTLIQLNMFGKPAYFFKQQEMLARHIESRDENDLVIIINEPGTLDIYSKYSHSSAKYILLDTSYYPEKDFKAEDVYHVIDDHGDFYQALTYFQQVLMYPINELMGGFSHEQ